ncbi:hypothetical protein BY458DRAFT_504320 [Sporodiniella umbellata]|nr:hypothetical protein BY458DRAFT_504320 [Sporodiniella umbellata]
MPKYEQTNSILLSPFRYVFNTKPFLLFFVFVLFLMEFSNKAVALCDFKAENKDELAISTGELITVIQKDEGFEDGWWTGKNAEGQVGLFPMACISHQPIYRQCSTFSNSLFIEPSDQSIFKSELPVSSEKLEGLLAQSISNSELSLKSPEYWDTDQVDLFLHLVGFASIAENFKSQEITGDILLELNMDSLKELEVSTFGKRFRLKAVINALRKYCATNFNRLQITNQPKDTDNEERLLSPKEQAFMTISHKKRVKLPQQPDKLNFRRSISSSNSQNATFPAEYNGIRAEIDTTSQVEGWLHKQSCKYRIWNKRWFVLKGPNLFYFKSPKDVRMKGIINLRGYRIIYDSTIQPGKYSFKAHHDQERTFYFYTEKESQMRYWINNLMKATILRDFKAPVLSSRVIPSVSLDVARRMSPRPPSILFCSKMVCNTSLVTATSIDSGFDSDPTSSSSSIRPWESDIDSWGQAEFIEWVNAICPEASISSLSQLNQENLLTLLLQELSGKKIVSKQSHDTVSLAFEFMSKENVIGVNEIFNTKDILQGNQEKIILMLKSILEWSL